jgi:hypothetical protein
VTASNPPRLQPPEAADRPLDARKLHAADAPLRPPTGRRSDIREIAGVVGAALAAVLAVGLVIAVRGARDQGLRRSAGPRSIVPARVPYADLLSGRVGAPDGAGRVELRYDFQPLSEGPGQRFLSDLGSPAHRAS